MITSRIDFAIPGSGVEPSTLSLGWRLSDYSAIGCLVAVDDVKNVVGYREAVDWLKVLITVADKSEDWYGTLVMGSAYERLVDFRKRHLKRLKICGRSQRWLDADLSRQVKAIQRERQNWCCVGHRNVLRAEITEMKRMVREKKEKCWRAFCDESGLQSPWKVVRWARDPWHIQERMGRLRGRNGV